MVAQALGDFKTCTILEYMILNSKRGLTGCILGYSFVSVLFLSRQSNIAACFYICSCFKDFLFVCFVISV